MCVEHGIVLWLVRPHRGDAILERKMRPSIDFAEQRQAKHMLFRNHSPNTCGFPPARTHSGSIALNAKTAVGSG